MSVYIKRFVCMIVFAAGLIGILTASSFVFAPKNNMPQFGMEEVSANGILGERENSIDVLVLGDSEAYSSISPMQIFKDTGFTSYVCATAGQPLDYTVVMLHRAFEKQSPKIVILETDAIYRKISAKNAVISRLSAYFSIFRYHDRWKKLSWNDFKGTSNFTWTDDFKGYKYNAKVDGCTKTDHMQPTKTAAEIPARNIKYVKEIKEFCDANGAKLVFLSTPSTVNWNYPRHNGIEALASDLGCEYVDLNLMNDKVGIDWEKDTRDKGDHLNHAGAVKVTAFLSRYLKEKDLFTDHRQDNAFATWQRALKNYEAAVK